MEKAVNCCFDTVLHDHMSLFQSSDLFGDLCECLSLLMPLLLEVIVDDRLLQDSIRCLYSNDVRHAFLGCARLLQLLNLEQQKLLELVKLLCLRQHLIRFVCLTRFAVSNLLTGMLNLVVLLREGLGKKLANHCNDSVKIKIEQYNETLAKMVFPCSPNPPAI